MKKTLPLHLLCWLICLFCLTLCVSLTSCNQNPVDESETTSEPETTTPVESDSGTTGETEFVEDEFYLTLVADEAARYTLVRADVMKTIGVQAATSLKAFIEEKTGVNLPIKTDFVMSGETMEDDGLEILVGKTNRSLSKELMEGLEEYQFAIKSTDRQLAIVGYSDECLYEGMLYFLETYMTDEYVEISEGTMKIKKNIFYQSDGSSHAFEKLLHASQLFDSSCEALFTIPRPNDTAKALQGGFTDGTYYYQAFIRKDTASNEANNDVYIVKYDMENKKVVKVSESLPLNHANDITLNTKTNQLVVVHNNPNRTYVSLIDPENLTLIKTVRIAYKIYCIDYNPMRNQYVIGLSGGQSFRILDEEFRSVSDAFEPTESTTGYTTQGCACDDNFIYFVLYNQNVITVYDWTGAFVTLIRLNVGSIEPENLSVVNGRIYVACSSGGGKVFSVTPVLTAN